MPDSEQTDELADKLDPDCPLLLHIVDGVLGQLEHRARIASMKGCSVICVLQKRLLVRRLGTNNGGLIEDLAQLSVELKRRDEGWAQGVLEEGVEGGERLFKEARRREGSEGVSIQALILDSFI